MAALGSAQLDLIFERSLSEEIILAAETREQLCKEVRACRLDRCELATLSCWALQRLPNLQSLYLQRNELTSIACLTSLSSLRFLSVAHNRLTGIEGIGHLAGLMTLDVSHNQLGSIAVSDIPCGIRYLMVADNPCSAGERGPPLLRALAAALPMLREVDGQAKEFLSMDQGACPTSPDGHTSAADGDSSCEASDCTANDEAAAGDDRAGGDAAGGADVATATAAVSAGLAGVLPGSVDASLIRRMGADGVAAVDSATSARAVGGSAGACEDCGGGRPADRAAFGCSKRNVLDGAWASLDMSAAIPAGNVLDALADVQASLREVESCAVRTVDAPTAAPDAGQGHEGVGAAGGEASFDATAALMETALRALQDLQQAQVAAVRRQVAERMQSLRHPKPGERPSTAGACVRRSWQHMQLERPADARDDPDAVSGPHDEYLRTKDVAARRPSTAAAASTTVAASSAQRPTTPLVDGSGRPLSTRRLARSSESASADCDEPATAPLAALQVHSPPQRELSGGASTPILRRECVLAASRPAPGGGGDSACPRPETLRGAAAGEVMRAASADARRRRAGGLMAAAVTRLPTASTPQRASPAKPKPTAGVLRSTVIAQSSVGGAAGKASGADKRASSQAAGANVTQAAQLKTGRRGSLVSGGAKSTMTATATLSPASGKSARGALKSEAGKLVSPAAPSSPAALLLPCATSMAWEPLLQLLERPIAATSAAACADLPEAVEARRSLAAARPQAGIDEVASQAQAVAGRAQARRAAARRSADSVAEAIGGLQSERERASALLELRRESRARLLRAVDKATTSLEDVEHQSLDAGDLLDRSARLKARMEEQQVQIKITSESLAGLVAHVHSHQVSASDLTEVEASVADAPL